MSHLEIRGLTGAAAVVCRFDSGSSWAGVLSREGLTLPADLYLEGSDQHRGTLPLLPIGKFPYVAFCYVPHRTTAGRSACEILAVCAGHLGNPESEAILVQ